jgi:SNF2 family DNA or RNA helicase
VLTGTIITGKEIDVFSPYKVLDPRIFGSSFYSFRNRYFDMVGYGGYTPAFRESMTDDFLRRLHSIAFRITKKECLDLPAVTEEVRTVSLELKARKLYDEIEKESYASLKGSEVTTVNILTKILRLSQLTGGFITDDDGNVMQVSTAKLDALSDIIDSAMEDDNKVVVMVRFIAEMDAIEAMLQKKGIRYSLIRGGVNDRQEQIDRFQKDPGCKVFVGQIAAAGLGITLTAAHVMVFYSMDYSMANFEQAKARIHRVSQTENCHYVYLCCKNTIDRKVLRALRDKVNLAKTLVDDYRKGSNPFR